MNITRVLISLFIIEISNAQKRLLCCPAINHSKLEKRITTNEFTFGNWLYTWFEHSINNQIDPHMRENVFWDYFSKLNLSINSLNTKSFNYSIEKHINYHKCGNIGLLLLINILLFLIFVIFKKYKLCSKTKTILYSNFFFHFFYLK